MDQQHLHKQKQPPLSIPNSAPGALSSQQGLFGQFLETIKLRMQPEGRAQHMAGMHQYLLTLLPPDATLADLVVGWRVLAQSRNDTNSEVLHRRNTCGELATIATALTRRQGDLTRAIATWQAWLNASQNSTNPRLTVMRATFTREMGELQAAAEQATVPIDVHNE